MPFHKKVKKKGKKPFAQSSIHLTLKGRENEFLAAHVRKFPRGRNSLQNKSNETDKTVTVTKANFPGKKQEPKNRTIYGERNISIILASC